MHQPLSTSLDLLQLLQHWWDIIFVFMYVMYAFNILQLDCHPDVSSYDCLSIYRLSSYRDFIMILGHVSHVVSWVILWFPSLVFFLFPLDEVRTFSQGFSVGQCRCRWGEVVMKCWFIFRTLTCFAALSDWHSVLSFKGMWPIVCPLLWNRFFFFPPKLLIFHQEGLTGTVWLPASLNNLMGLDRGAGLSEESIQQDRTLIMLNLY